MTDHRSDDDADQFLYHLHRGSELLIEDRVLEAKDALERALERRPQDAKSQDLLAGVYFRLGVYPRAIEIWGRLVEAYPTEPTLRVNLGLSLFKTGQSEKALVPIEEALKLQSDHPRARRYLGMIRWRLGQLREARQAFIDCGEQSMVARIDEALASSTGLHPSVSPAEADRRAQTRLAAAEKALRAIEAEEGTEAETIGALGASAMSGLGPRPAEMSAASVRALKNLPLRAATDAWTVTPTETSALRVLQGGELQVQVTDEVYARIDGVITVTGQLRTEAVKRQIGGREDLVLLGAATPIFRWNGPVSALMAPPEGKRLLALRVEDELFFVREDRLFAFEKGLVFESAQIAIGNEMVQMTQLRGRGLAVILLEVGREPLAVKVTEGQETRVDPRRLVGWVGRLFPSAPRGTAPYSAAAPRLIFRGAGTLFVM